MKYHIDDWVLYRPFYDSEKDSTLYKITHRAVILHVFKKEEYYDYEIFIDDGSSKIKKVKQECLESISK